MYIVDSQFSIYDLLPGIASGAFFTGREYFAIRYFQGLFTTQNETISKDGMELCWVVGSRYKLRKTS